MLCRRRARCQFSKSLHLRQVLAGTRHCSLTRSRELEDLVRGSLAVYKATGGTKDILPEEQPTIDFAYACVVSLREIAAGAKLTRGNIWVKRPGTGEIEAVHFEDLLGKTAKRALPADTQLRWGDFE